MDTTSERRTEERLRYHWPVFFAEDVNNGDLGQGQMTDVSSRGAAFTYYTDQYNLHPGQHVTARFSVPQYGSDGSFNVVDFIRSGRVCRVEMVNHTLRRIAMQFADPLPFRPGEQETDLDQDDWDDEFELGLY